MEVINLNIIPGKAQPVVHASQYDVGRVIRCNLFEGAEVFYLDGTETISCNIKKPDNNIVTLSVTNTNDSYVEITTTEQATACDGSNLCEISITKGDDIIGSLNFIMEVERSPIEGGISSASEINNLWTQVDGMVADALATQYDSANVVFDNLPTEGHGIPYTVTSEGIGNAIDNALDMTDTASGAIATFDTSLSLPLQDCTIAINAVQTGTLPPSPSNVCPISGFTGANIKDCGVNLWDEVYRNGYYNNSGEFVSQASTICNTNPIVVYGGMQLYIHSGTYHISLFFYDENGNYLSNLYQKENTVITVPASAKTMNWTAGYGEGSTYNNDISINYPATDTAYHAYNSTTTAITWNDEAGTVYGGSLDVTSGVLTVTHGFKTYTGASGENWIYETTGGGYKNFYINIADAKIAQLADSTLKCNISPVSNNWAMPDTCFISNGRNFNFTWGDSLGITSAADFKTWLGSNNMQVCYELATPVTYQLTPTQISAIVGTNNVFTDTNGDTSLEYYTKRGEQTVRIAEGVAVDVINNKNIDTLATTDKTVKGAINELDGIIDGIKAIETLFVTNTIATSTTEYTTYNSRKFSDYDFYLFKIGASALDVRRTVILSKADWISGASINEVMLHGSTASTPSSYTASTFTAGYHSDTSFDANVSGSGSLNYLTIHGIRKN